MKCRKKVFINLICIVLLIPCLNINAFAEEDTDESNNQGENINYGIWAFESLYTAEEMLSQSRFLQPGGHGFAAEEANNLIDKFSGVNAKVVGYDNAANGADRMITRSGKTILIQTKYWSTPNDTIQSAFDNSKDGIYKYIDSDGNPMQLEVPSDQYDEVVQKFSEKIKEGKVQGVSNPDEAKNIVKKGNITFEQAKNIAKAGTFDSLKYDSLNGCITATTAFGISTTFDFVIRKMNGESTKDALKESAITGLKSGTVVFAMYVVTSQLARTSAVNIFEPSAEALVNTFGDDFAKTLINVYGINRTGNEATKKAAINLLKNQALATTVAIVVISLPDAVDLIRGRISAEQMIKNLAITTGGAVGGVVGGVAGGAAGNAIMPGVGTTVGKFIGSSAGTLLGSYGTEKVMDIFIKDDAEKMMEIIQNVFYEESINYMASESEADKVAEQLAMELKGSTLKDMFESENKEDFAKLLICPLFENVISERTLVNIPSSEEMRYELKNQLEGVVFIH